MALKPIRKHFKKSGSHHKDSRRWKSNTSTFIGASGGVIDTYIYNYQPDNEVKHNSSVLKIGTDWDDTTERLNYYRPLLHFGMGITGATLGDLPENTTIDKAELTLTILNPPWKETKCEIGLVPPETLVDSCNWSHYAHGSTASNTAYNWIGDDSTDLITDAGHDVYENIPNATIVYPEEETVPGHTRVAYRTTTNEFISSQMWYYSGQDYPVEDVYPEFADDTNGIKIESFRLLHSGSHNYSYPGMFEMISANWNDTEWPLTEDRRRSCFLESWGYDPNNLKPQISTITKQVGKEAVEEIETVGGLVFSKINRIPLSNEEFNIDDIINIKVLRANERKIITVQITKIVS